MARTQSQITEDMNESYGTVPAQGTVHLQRLMPADIQTLWSYLTESEKCAQWLNTINAPFKEGGSYDVTFDNNKLTGEPTPEEFGTGCHDASGKILVFDPPKTLSYTWKMGETDTVVLFELTPQGDRTLLSVTHSNLPARSTMLNVASGWHTHIDLLISKLARKKPGPFWALFMKLKSEYERIIPE